MATALTALRRTRRSRRLGDAEWFDLAYHVYLAGIFGGSAIIIASDFIGDEQLAPEAVADVLAHGPAVLGLLAVLAFAGGLRSGSEGGPVSVEAADVVHLLLAPISRFRVLIAPLLQRLRAIVAGATLAGGTAGLLTAQRLPGGAADWTLSGAAFGACVGATFVAAATIAHAGRLPGWGAALVAAPLVGWQIAAIAGSIDGPGDTLGSLAMKRADGVGVALDNSQKVDGLRLIAEEPATRAFAESFDLQVENRLCGRRDLAVQFPHRLPKRI